MRIAVLDRDGREMAVCGGPAWSGACPSAAPGTHVACAGSKLDVRSRDGAQLLVVSVAPDATACPLAAFRLHELEQREAD